MTTTDVRPAPIDMVSGLLGRLDPEQRAAAVLPDGPALIIAPAGSGKTTTLVARLGVLLARGVPAARIAVATFNRDAARELSARIAARLVPSLPAASEIEVRTLHALARQILLDAGEPVRLVSDRLPILRALLRRQAAERDGRGEAPSSGAAPDAATLDTAISAWKVEGRPFDGSHRSLAEGYRAMLIARGEVDFDDLVVGAADRLEADSMLRQRWQGRFSHLCVDEFQDVDAAQLRLVRLLAEPERNLFVVGDDDQTIYAWRLADVRRILSFESLYPGTRRVQLATNYRCPPPIVAASRRLIEVNRERFAKRIEAGADGPPATAMVAMATTNPDWADRLAVLASRDAGGGRRICFLARTRAELGPVVLALTRAGIPHATAVPAPLQADPVRALISDAGSFPGHVPPFQVLLSVRAARGWRRGDAADALGEDDHAALDALLGWAVGYATLDRFLEDEARALARLEALRRSDALVELVTVHGAKGREWPTVVVLGMEADRFPNRRALVGGDDPERALEEERRLAYVATTRATERLILAYDPARPSRFLIEMGLAPRARPPARPA